MIELFGHPFSSYTWKALIPFYENDIAFDFKVIGPDNPENYQRLCEVSPMAKFPVLIDGDVKLYESSIIIEYLDTAYTGNTRFLADDFHESLMIRTLDRFFDNYIMNTAQAMVDNAIRPAEKRDMHVTEITTGKLLQAYRWLDGYLVGKKWLVNDRFSLVECGAAPSLFYTDWIVRIPEEMAQLQRYRAQLLARPSVAKCVDGARPFRQLFPLGAPDRD